jgi:hypothetical protein
VTTALGALLLVAGHRDQLAAELLRGAHVDEVHVALERGEHLVAVRADRLVARLRDEALRLEARDLGGRRAALADPLLARAVEQLDVLVAVVLEVPVRVGGEPVAAVAVQHDRVLVEIPRDPNSSPNASGPRKSRRTWSWRSLRQSNPIAPGMCASA